MSSLGRHPVTYSKEIRSKATYGLSCIDIYPFKGTRITAWGPMSEEDAKVLVACWKKLIRMHGAKKRSK